ncbi:MAG: ribosome biogenesis GTPase [Planctomycetota bacterium]|jgi:ribosome biogenesis GTPase
MKKARVIEEHKTNYIISDGETELVASVRGAFFAEGDFPKVGDYVLASDASEGKAVIEEVLPRTSVIVRRAVEARTPQVLVANVDVIFIVMGLDKDFNISRLERYLLLAKQSNVKPVVVLNKSDVIEGDIETYLSQTQEVAGTAPVHDVSALTNQNMDDLLQYLQPGVTAVLLGSSGAGKSTIVNWLLRDDTQKVSEVRESDNRGRHTTTSRQLFTLPTGAYLIDTPGMRELSLQDTTVDDENSVFVKIEEFSTRCKFYNCDHEKSIGCAIVAALQNGDILEREFSNYKKIQRERIFEEVKQDKKSSRLHYQGQKELHKGYKEIVKKKRFEKGV